MYIVIKTNDLFIISIVFKSIEQIDFILRCVCTVIDHGWRELEREEK